MLCRLCINHYIIFSYNKYFVLIFVTCEATCGQNSVKGNTPDSVNTFSKLQTNTLKGLKLLPGIPCYFLSLGSMRYVLTFIGFLTHKIKISQHLASLHNKCI